MPLSYPWLYDTVRQRFASDDAMEAFLPQPLSADALQQLGDDRYLSAISRRVFQAGMQHSVVDARWPAFEQAFWNFVPEKVVMISPEQLEAHLKNERLIRHLTKLQTIPQNALLILDIRQQYGGSFGDFIADWPTHNIIGLWRLLAKRGARLGGRSAASFLRLVGKDTFLLTSDVVARLQAAGVIDHHSPSSQRDLQAIQNTFNALQQRSGRPLCQLSAMLSLSINPRF